MGRLVITAVLLALAVPASAGAVELRLDTGKSAHVYQRWADASAVPTAPGVVTIHPTACITDGGESCTLWPGRHMWINADTGSQRRVDVTHELGHTFDYRVMTVRARVAFRLFIGDRRSWRTTPNSPHEKFAAAYGLCARHRVIRATFDAGYDYRVTPGLHRRVCRMIRRAAAGAFG